MIGVAIGGDGGEFFSRWDAAGCWVECRAGGQSKPGAYIHTPGE